MGSRRCLQLPKDSDNDAIIINKDKIAHQKSLDGGKPSSGLAEALVKFTSDDFPVTRFNFSMENAETEEGLAETILFYKYLR